MKRKEIKKRILQVLILLTFSLSACSKQRTVEPETVLELPVDASSENVKQALSATPSSTEDNKESGISAENYEDYTFAGYKGKISFYYTDDTLMYYKWHITENDTKQATRIYEDVCMALAGTYGEGTVSDNATSNLYTTTWETEEQQIVAQKVSSGNGYEISYMVVG